MSIRNAFGRLLLSVSEKLKRLAETLGVTDTGLEDTTETSPNPTLIWDVIDGPHNRDEFDEEELEAIGIDDSLTCFLVVKLQENGAVGTVNFWVQDVEEAYDIIEYFKNNIEPLELSD